VPLLIDQLHYPITEQHPLLDREGARIVRKTWYYNLKAKLKNLVTMNGNIKVFVAMLVVLLVAAAVYLLFKYLLERDVINMLRRGAPVAMADV
jgi:hypothetical protein